MKGIVRAAVLSVMVLTLASGLPGCSMSLAPDEGQPASSLARAHACPVADSAAGDPAHATAPSYGCHPSGGSGDGSGSPTTAGAGVR